MHTLWEETRFAFVEEIYDQKIKFSKLFTRKMHNNNYRNAQIFFAEFYECRKSWLACGCFV